MSGVPFLDLAAQRAALGTALQDAVAAVLSDHQYILGPHLERFEAAMAAYTGMRHALGVGSGTDALALALAALDVGPGTRVLTTPFTFFATASTIARLGACPVFVDIDADTMNLEPDGVAAALAAAPGTIAGLVPVDLFGRLAPMPALAALTARHGLWIVEDAAQAIGARADGAGVGRHAAAACLSFYPTKNLGGVGDGGMVLTSDDDLAARVRRDRHQGQVAPYVHETLGLCSRLDAVQAAALHAKLGHLDAWNAGRRRVAGWYGALFVEHGLAGSPESSTARALTGSSGARPDAPLVLPAPAGEAHVFHQYVIRARQRDALRAHLSARSIGSQVYYGIPLHRQPVFAHLGYGPGAFPVAERAAAEVLALPIYPELTQIQVATVVEAIADFYRATR